MPQAPLIPQIRISEHNYFSPGRSQRFGIKAMLIFDFDGVLINSLDEVVLTTYNAATGSLCTSLAQVPVDLLQMFKNNRFHVQPIGDAIALMNWCLANRQGDLNKILTPEEYGTIADGTDIPLTDRTNLIYDTRNVL